MILVVKGIFFRQSWKRACEVLVQYRMAAPQRHYMIGEDIPLPTTITQSRFSQMAIGVVAMCQLNNELEPYEQRCKALWIEDALGGSIRSFRSLHPGGANFAKADASVQFCNRHHRQCGLSH